ncbi:MAG: hypothetical protein ABI639_11125 [Thermoanaerobaculia bacterium]
MASSNPLVDQVLSGQSRELQLLAAQGILPLSAQELIPLQVELSASESAEISGYARSSLEELDPNLAATFVGTEASEAVLEYFASNPSHPLVIEALLRRRDVPRDLLIDLASRLSADLQENLLLRQDAIIEEPEILNALETNPALSVYSRRKIAEYREHLLPRERRSTPDTPVELAALDLDAADIAAIEKAKELPAIGERDERTGLTESQVRALTVPLKIKLSRGASRTLRNVLVRDTNQSVALSVMNNSAMSEDEIAQVAGSRSVIDEVLTLITRRREWVAKYKVCWALVRNPRIAVGVAVRLLPKLSVRDLRTLSRDRNVSDGVRSAAGRLYRIKTK